MGTVLVQSQEGEGEADYSGVEGGEPDGVLLEEEMLRGILAKRKSWAGLKCGKNQASCPAWMYVLLAFVLGITLMLGVAMRGAELRKVFGSPCISELRVRCWAGHSKRHTFLTPFCLCTTCLCSYGAYSPLVKSGAHCSACSKMSWAEELQTLSFWPFLVPRKGFHCH